MSPPLLQVLAIGDIAPGLLLHTSATGAMGNVAYAQRLTNSSIQMTWQFSGYVQQANRYTSPPTAWDIKFHPNMVGMSPRLVPSAPGFTATCRPWTSVADNTPLTYNSSSYSCADENCVPIPQSDLPYDLISGMTDPQKTAGLYWVEYYMTVTCVITKTSSLQLIDDFVLPASTLNVDYRLMNTSQVEVTDVVTPPFSSIAEVAYTSPGIQLPSATFPLQSRLTALAETVISQADTLSDIVYGNEGQPALTGNLAYSQAFQYTVQLSDVGTRKYWQVMPALVLMVAHTLENGAPALTSGTQQVTPGSLPVSWCGLDRGDIAGAWALVDSAPTAGNSSGAWLRNFAFDNTGKINRLGPIYSDIASVMSPDLLTAVSTLLTNNTVTSIDQLQYNLLPSGAAPSQRVAVVSDSTGGFSVPIRNRFFINGKVSGYQLSFCSITQAVPYLPMAVNDVYPLYTTKDAALADTLAVGGVISDPKVVYGTAFNGGSNNFIKYYLPSKPASTGGVVCMFQGQYTALGLSGVTREDPNDTNSVCAALVQKAILDLGGDFQATPTPSGRRMLRSIVPKAKTQAASGLVIAHTFSVSSPTTSSQFAYQTSPNRVRILPKGFGTPLPPPNAPSPNPPPNSPSPPSPPPPPPSPFPPPPPPLTNQQLGAINTNMQDVVHNTDKTSTWIIVLVAIVGAFFCSFIGVLFARMWSGKKRNETVTSMNNGQNETASTYRSGGNYAPKLVWAPRGK